MFDADNRQSEGERFFPFGRVCDAKQLVHLSMAAGRRNGVGRVCPKAEIEALIGVIHVAVQDERVDAIEERQGESEALYESEHRSTEQGDRP